MTIKERILSVYNNNKPDKIPVSIYNRYHRYGEVERIARNNGLGILDFYPVVSLLAPPWHVKPGYVSEVKNSSFDIKLIWDKGKQVEVRVFETPVGKISQQITKDNAYGSDWTQKHYLENPEDYKVMQYIIENTVLKPQEKVIKQRIADLGQDGVVLGRVDRSPYQKLLTELANPETFMPEIYTNPSTIEELIETMNKKCEEQFLMAMESEIEVIWQPDNITADMTPPDMYEKYVLPFYTKHGEQCRKAGKPYLVHIDGRTRGIKNQIAQSPFDVVESFSFSEMAGDVSVSDAFKIWPDKVLCPNFPASLIGESEAYILDYLENKKKDFQNRPFMIQVSEDIPIESYLRLLSILSKFS
jgi:uroporphyrinogen-III decarboxylase